MVACDYCPFNVTEACRVSGQCLKKEPMSTNPRIKIGVINSHGELIGVFNEKAYAEAFMAGLHAEQMRKVGYVVEYATVPVDLKECWVQRT